MVTKTEGGGVEPHSWARIAALQAAPGTGTVALHLILIVLLRPSANVLPKRSTGVEMWTIGTISGAILIFSFYSPILAHASPQEADRNRGVAAAPETPGEANGEPSAGQAGRL